MFPPYDANFDPATDRVPEPVNVIAHRGYFIEPLPDGACRVHNWLCDEKNPFPCLQAAQAWLDGLIGD